MAPVVVALLASDDDVQRIAGGLTDDLAKTLADDFPDTDFEFVVVEMDRADLSAGARELVEGVRRRLLDEGWELAIGLTQLPLRSRGRPVTAQASASHGVGLISLPALGGLRFEHRLLQAIVRLVESLLGRSDGRMGGRLLELGSPLGHVRARDDGTVRFVGAALRGNLRLLMGMVRANEPSTVIARLSKALVAALGTAAFALASSNVWNLADGLSALRLLGLAILSIGATCVTLILAHGLWERARDPRARERVILFNLATVITVAIGVVSLYLALFVITTIGAAALIAPDVFREQLGHPVGIANYLHLSWLVASLATIGGALGSVIESDLAVRNAAHRFRAPADQEAPA